MRVINDWKALFCVPNWWVLKFIFFKTVSDPKRCSFDRVSILMTLKNFRFYPCLCIVRALRNYCIMLKFLTASITVKGYVHLLSPVKTAHNRKNNYFEMTLQTPAHDSQRLVGYYPERRREIKNFESAKNQKIQIEQAAPLLSGFKDSMKDLMKEKSYLSFTIHFFSWEFDTWTSSPFLHFMPKLCL